MRLGKAVLAEAENLLVDLARERLVVAAFAHAVDESLLEHLQAALALPCGHRTTQPIGLARRETGRDDRELHHLLLEDRHAERALEHALDRIARIRDRLELLPPFQIRMHHAALDRAGPHDGDLDHEVVERCGPQARQHRLLRARFDLEYADRVGLLDHRVDRGVLGRNVFHPKCLAAARRHHLQRAANRGEHAEREAIDLEQSHRVEVVLVPLDDRALFHRGVLDRHHALETIARDDEAADVLRQVARKAQQMTGEDDHASQHRIFGIEAGLANAIAMDRATIPPCEYATQAIELREIEAERAPDVAYGALRLIGDERRGKRRAVAAVLVVDVLHHRLAPLMLEVDVDVRRLVALPADETLEQHLASRRVDFGDA